jgi:WD40 repeat protein/uncharacterized caspase-like protein
MRQHLTLSLVTLVFLLSPTHAQKPELSIQTGHAGVVVSLAFTSDSKILASGSVDNTIKLWDPATGNQLRALKGHDMTVTALEFSPDDMILASGSSDKTIKLWDFSNGRVKQTFAGHTLHVSSIAFSPDGKILASGGADQNVKFWDVASGRELRSLVAGPNSRQGMGTDVAFSRDGKTLASAGEVVKFWDVSSGRELRTIIVNPASSSPSETVIAFNYDGTMLATGGKTIKLWDVATGNTLRALPGEANALDFSPDRNILAVCNLTEIKLWDTRSGQELRTWEGARQGVDALAFSNDGKLLASGNSDHTVTLWDPAKGHEISVLKGYVGAVTSMALSADGKVLANGIFGGIGRHDNLKIWDPVTGQLSRSLTGQHYAAYSIALSKSGDKLVSGSSGNAVGLWDVSQAEPVRKFKETVDRKFVPDQVALSADGRLIAAAGRNDMIKLWEAETGRQLLTLKGHKNGTRDLAFSPDGELLASCAQDKTIKLWSVSTGQELKTLTSHVGVVGTIAFSPDGKKLASGSHDKMTLLWDVASGNLEDAFMGHSSWVNTVAFSRDGQKLASGSEDGVIRMWDTSTRRHLQTFTGHTDKINSVTFSVDGKLLISGSTDTSIKLWDVATGKELASLVSLNQQDWLVVTPDGLFDGSPTAWSQILWRFSANLFDVKPVELFFNEYYYPGLLAELYAGKRPVAPQNIAQKDRRQPVLKLMLANQASAEAEIGSRLVTVKIEVGSALAGAQDVRLFRNGALVKAWRGDVLKGQRQATLQAEIPIVAGANRLTAYAFNRDNVKSADATLTIAGASSLKRSGTLYILAFAVNKYANPQFDLRYAVADATDFAAELQRQETRLGRFERTEIISLHDAQATKANILRALTNLSTRLKPEDALVVYYAGHGTAQQNQFYLIPHDLGYQGARNRLNAASLPAVLAHSISDRELERAFESMDAGQFLLVIDACNSGQALEAEEKRRGPMNSKGLAQLAYEKGIYILTAAQSYQAALEQSDLKHGLLTYALVEEGLKKGAADSEPRDGEVLVREWFSYVTRRVPEMQEARMRQASQSGRQLAYVEGEEENEAAKRNIQRPRTFYRRELEAQPFVIAKIEVAPP